MTPNPPASAGDEVIDAIASWPHYWSHIEPVWDALPDAVRGARYESKPIPSQRDAVLVSSMADLAAATKAGYQRIAYLEHGIGQSYGNRHAGYPGGMGRDRVSLFLSPNETAAARDRAAYPRARVEVVGDPRLDTLPARVPDGQVTVCMSGHWESSHVQRHEARPAWPYYRDVLPELAKSVNLIGHAHPRASMARMYAKLGIEFVPDFDDVLRRADLYVCDNSSTIYEFASTGRPVVLLNAPWYRRDVELGLRFWEAAGVGIQVDKPYYVDPETEAPRSFDGFDLFDAVDLVLDEYRYHPDQELPVRTDREAALNIAYGYRSGAGERAAAVIADWLADIAVAA